MSFYDEAVTILERIVKALNGDCGFKKGGANYSRRAIYRRLNVFDKKRFLSTRLRIGACDSHLTTA